jgi:hypothetical protein
VVLILCGLLIGIRTLLVGFVDIKVAADYISLGYCWPRNQVVLPTNNKLKIEIQPVGYQYKNSVIIVIKSANEVYESTSMNIEKAEKAMAYLNSRNNIGGDYVE